MSFASLHVSEIDGLSGGIVLSKWLGDMWIIGLVCGHHLADVTVVREFLICGVPGVDSRPLCPSHLLDVVLIRFSLLWVLSFFPALDHSGVRCLSLSSSLINGKEPCSPVIRELGDRSLPFCIVEAVSR